MSDTFLQDLFKCFVLINLYLDLFDQYISSGEPLLCQIVLFSSLK